MNVEWDMSELLALADDAHEAARRALPAAREVAQGSARALRDRWRANARATAGRHGRHYPASITYSVRALGTSVVADVGPETRRPQGGMGPGFEYGSVNQPPHRDGGRALAAVEEPFVKAVGEIVEGLL